MRLKVAIVGSGAREHILAEVFLEGGFDVAVIPGNDGMKRKGIPILSVSSNDVSLEKAVIEYRADIVIVGPTEYMVNGLVEKLKEKGIKVIGATSSSAMLEADKVFAKHFMKKHGIPTPPFRIVHTISQLERALKEWGSPYVIKIPTLAGGKGSFILPTLTEALDIGTKVITSGFEGLWSEGLVVEKYVAGEEYAVQVLMSSGDYVLLPMVWEYQRLYEGGRGPNTGGMGAVAPIRVSDTLFEEIRSLVDRVVKGLLKEGLMYDGFLYIGLMVSSEGLYVLEFNVRLGDPETEAVVSLAPHDFVHMIRNTAFGRLPEPMRPSGVAVALSLVGDGAPYGYKEVPISISEENVDGVYFDHVREKDGTLYVNGWRPCVVVGKGDSYEDAIEEAYRKAELISFEGKYFRKDIGDTLR